MKLYIQHLFKQSTTFDGDSWSIIDKGIFYRALFNFKMFIFNVYKNLFDKCNSFVLLQKMLEFFMVFWWWFSRNHLQLVYFQDKNYVYLFPWCCLFWFLLTILSIVSLTAFPLISVKSQISTAPISYKYLTYKCSFYLKPVHYLTATKINCIWGKCIYAEAIQITSSSGIYKTNIYHNDSYLRLFEKRKWQSFQISYE